MDYIYLRRRIRFPKSNKPPFGYRNKLKSKKMAVVITVITIAIRNSSLYIKLLESCI